MKIPSLVMPEQASAHLEKAVWKKVNRLHLRKILAEFAHEGIITPKWQANDGNWGVYTVATEDQQTVYRFKAQVLALQHWYIQTDSIEKYGNGLAVPLDSLRFVVEFHVQMGIPAEALPVYMEEVSSTLSGSAHMHYYGKPTSAELTQAGYQQIEGTMTGHPRFIANNGRIGFDATDYRLFAPEAAEPFALLWLAGHAAQAEFTAISTLDYQQVIRQELGTETLRKFENILTKKGLNPEQYFFFPVHPWQWFNKLANVFAADIATQQLVCLGYSDDQYLPQQSIRTFFNVSHPEKFYVKTALSILNMGYVRGLSPYFMRTNPAINEWIHALVEQDAYLQEKGFCILREVAAISYVHQYYELAIAEDSQYKKMLACLWREGPVSKLKEGQQLMTMAALLHTDNEGVALLPQLIQASGLDTSAWLSHYFACYFSPLLHCFYQWDMVYMPHGENLIMVLENHVPVRAIMKDIGEEVSILNSNQAIPEAAARLCVTVDESNKTAPLFTQVFDSIFRFISAILVEHADFPEARFWELVAACILDYQQTHPQLKEEFEKYDLFVPEFSPDALNRLQLHNNRQLRNRANPFKDLPSVQKLQNPITTFKNTLIFNEG